MKHYLLIPFLTLFLFCSSVSLLAQSENSNTTPLIPIERVSSQSDMDDEKPIIQTSNESDSFTAKFMRMLFILALLVGFMILASMMLKKMTRSRVTQMNDKSVIKVVEARTLSPKSTLYLLNIDNKDVLIAESNAGVSYLATFDVTDEREEDEQRVTTVI